MFDKRFKAVCLTVAVALIFGSQLPNAMAVDDSERPNWKGSATGTVAPDPGNPPFDCIIFAGKSSHLGKFTAEGCQILDQQTGMFAGSAIWTAANGDTLNVGYTGQVFPSGDPDFPFGFIGFLDADGGTGRLADAQGCAVFEVAFSGIPGEFFFDFEGTLHPQGK